MCIRDGTGRENVFLHGAILGMRRAEIAAKFDAIVAFSGVERFLETPLKHYSSGMAVRLAFSVAAHLEPEILIVDEVLAVGDAEFQKRCLERMGELTRGGCTLLFVSHNLGTLGALCETCILLERGRVRLHDRSATVIAAYSGAGANRVPATDILPEQRVKGDGSIRFQRARLSDAQGAPRTAFRIGEDIRLEIDLESARSDAVSFWLIVYDAAGRPLLSTHQRDRETVRIEPGRFRVVYETAGLGLMPGSYTIGAGAFDASLGFLEWVDHFQGFEVQPAFSNGTAFDHRWGAVDQGARWRLERA